MSEFQPVVVVDGMLLILFLPNQTKYCIEEIFEYAKIDCMNILRKRNVFQQDRIGKHFIFWTTSMGYTQTHLTIEHMIDNFFFVLGNYKTCVWTETAYFNYTIAIQVNEQALHRINFFI